MTHFFFAIILALSRAHAAGFWDAYPGARQNAMGSAFTAVADDPYAVFYNPAGLADQNNGGFEAGIGRRFSAPGPSGEISLAYVMSLRSRDTGNGGIGYYSFRQDGVGNKDLLLAGLGDGMDAGAYPYPLNWGVNFKLVRLESPGNTRWAAGLDAGLLTEFPSGFKAGLSLINFVTKIDASKPTFNAGVSYAWQNFLFAGDFRWNDGSALLLPGLELTLCNGFLKFRGGRGFPLDGTEQVALGMGIDSGEFTADAAFSFPFEGFYSQSGFYQISVGYRFGTPDKTPPDFSRAAQLAKEIAVLRRQKDLLESDTKQAEKNNERLAKEQDEIKAMREKEKVLLESQTDEIEKIKERINGELSALAAKHQEKAGLESEISLLSSQKERLGAELKAVETKPPAQPGPATEKSGAGALPREETPASPALPQPVSGNAAEPPSPEWPKRHTVTESDTLRSIAARYYGDPSLWRRILDANPDKMSKGLPVIGGVIEIPAPPPQKKP